MSSSDYVVNFMITMAVVSISELDGSRKPRVHVLMLQSHYVLLSDAVLAALERGSQLAGNHYLIMRVSTSSDPLGILFRSKTWFGNFQHAEVRLWGSSEDIYCCAVKASYHDPSCYLLGALQLSRIWRSCAAPTTAYHSPTCFQCNVGSLYLVISQRTRYHGSHKGFSAMGAYSLSLAKHEFFSTQKVSL